MDNSFQENISQYKPLFSLDLEDKDLITEINKRLDLGKKLRDNIVIKKGNLNWDYYKGQHAVKTLSDGKSKIVKNIIFRNIETIVPILTSNTPEPRIFHPNKLFTEKLRKILTLRWEVFDKMLEKSRKTIRHNAIRYLGALKVRYDTEYNDICWELVNPKHLIIDPDATYLYDCKWVAQLVKGYTVKEVIEKYPYGKEKLLKTLGIKSEDDKKLGSEISFIEFSTPDFTVWKYNYIILDKQENQNYDFEGVSTFDEVGKETKIRYNIFKKPIVPYIFFQLFNIENEESGIYGNTSLIEQAIPLQDNVNKRKRQVDENADEANGTLVGSGDYISFAQFQKLKGEATERVWVEKGDARMAISRLSGNPLQNYVLNDMYDSQGEIDNIMGSHSTTRGEGRQGETTATERVMEKQQDYGRIDDIVKAYEDFSEDYFNMTLQMMLVHYKDVHLFPIEQEDDIEVSREILIKEFSKIFKYKDSELRGGKYEVEYKYVPPVVMVKRGSTLPTDDITKRVSAIELWSKGGIDPISLHEELNDPNPELKAKRLFLFKNNPQLLFPELAQYSQTEGITPEGKYTEGMIADTEAIQKGQEPGVNKEMSNPATGQSHLVSHNTYIDSSEFEQADQQFKARYIAHVKAEIDFMKQQMAQAKNSQLQVNQQI